MIILIIPNFAFTLTDQTEGKLVKDRKKDHINLAFDAQIRSAELDPRFYYEPLFTIHPGDKPEFNLTIAGKKVESPFWVSSMTGGTEKAGSINRNLAKACAKYKMGMGLGSCRILLEQPEHLPDFDLRPLMGDDLPLFVNMGIPQLQEARQKNQLDQWLDLIHRLRADGIIIHINPWQEWMQPEGDLINHPPIETLQWLIDQCSLPIIVKEVGQGMGPASLKALLELPLEAVDFAANGGTNFMLVELLRSDEEKKDVFSELTRIGHSAEEMVDMTNHIRETSPDSIRCRNLIISGGISGFLEGYYLTEKSSFPALIGQASALLKRALKSYDDLDHYLNLQHRGWALCQNYLTLKNK